MNYSDVMKERSTEKLTENGARAYSTSGLGALVDLYATVGALRERDERDIEQKFAEAFKVSPLYALKILFYCGDIRCGGLGERRTFRIGLKWFAKEHPYIVKKNLEYIPYFNRFDSLFVLVGTSLEADMWDFYAKVLEKDMKQLEAGKPISLAAKWAPSENAHSKETKELAKKARQHWNLTPRVYRKMLSKLRKYNNIVETKMSAKEWDEINYETVPSKAMSIYNKSFGRHDFDRFDNYIKDVSAGKKEIKASTLYPYDLVHQVWCHKDNAVTEEQWKALPNYITEDKDYLIMADVSGSMYGRPIETSIGLATYFAERNKGHYHNLYMSFSEHPDFINLNGKRTLRDKVNYVRSKDIGYSTNLEAAFDTVLKDAIAFNLNNNELPQAFIVISDNEIDAFFGGMSYWKNYSLDFVQTMKRKYAAHGYKMPKLILWNVAARNDTFLTKDEDVLLVSGQSASVFSQLMGNLNGVTAEELMFKTLDREVYSCLKIS